MAERKRKADDDTKLAPVLGVAQVNVGVLRELVPRLNSVHEWAAVPENLYVGRAERYTGMPASKWANRYTIAKCGSRERALKAYEDHVRNGELWNRLHELSGKRLGCWCHTRNSSTTSPTPYCHADVLVALFNERYGQ